MSDAQTPAPEVRTNGRRPSFLAFFIEEWGLLLLAATLTFASWWIVRESVVQEHVVDDIRVVLQVDESVKDRLGAVFTGEPTVSIALNCSEREKNEALSALKRTGVRQVVLRVLGEPVDEIRDYEAGKDVFLWPFDDERILQPNFDPPSIKVFRLREREAEVAIPETVRSPEELRVEAGLEVSIDLTQRNFTFPAPEGVFDEVVVPDKIAINPSDWTLREDGTYEGPRKIKLTFRGWREEAGLDPWEQAYRRAFKMDDIAADVSLTVVEDDKFSNRLVVLADQSRWEFDFEQLRDEDSVSAGVDGLIFEGKLRGPKAVLDELRKEEAKSVWAWGIRFKQDPATEFKRPDVQKDSEGWVSLDAEIVWLPFAAFQNRGVVYEPVGLEKVFTAKVRERKSD